MRRDWLTQQGRGSEEATPLSDFGFNYPVEFVRRAYLYLQQGWGWPEAGGWAEQDGRLLDDIDRYHAEFAAVGKAVEVWWQGSDQYEDQEYEVEPRSMDDVLG